MSLRANEVSVAILFFYQGMVVIRSGVLASRRSRHRRYEDRVGQHIVQVYVRDHLPQGGREEPALPDAKRPQIRRAVDAYEGLRREKAQASGNREGAALEKPLVRRAQREPGQKRPRSRTRKGGKSK